MTDLPKKITMYPVRRSATVLGTAHTEDGRPVVAIGCDCGAVTDLVFEVDGAPSVTREVAFTCDGCLSAHWITISISAPE